MKISKIACVALLGASFAVSSAFATPQTDYDTAVSNKTNAIKANSDNQKTKAEAYNKVMAQVKVLQGIKELKDWDGTNTSADAAKDKAFKSIKAAVDAIKDELNNIKPDTGSIELVAADKTSKITIDNAGAVKINIVDNGGKQESTGGEKTLNFANPVANAADIAKIFSDKNANVWNEFVKAFADEHAKLVKERDEKLADDIKNTLDPAIQEKAVALATAETTATTYEGTVKNYDALNNALKNDVAAKEKVKADKEKELATAVKALQTGADKDKVALKGTDATSIAKQADAVTTAKNELTTAAAGSDDNAKKDALKKAIEAGVPVENAGKKLSAADVDKLSTSDLSTVTTAAAAAATTAETAMATVKTDATAVKAQDTIIETSTKAIADQKAKVKEISNTRAKAIATSENLDKGESDVLTALSDIFDSNARVESIIADESADDVAEGVSELHSTLDTATKSLNKGNFTDIVIFNTNLATNTRLAKLSNPYNGNLALAYAVKNMAGEKFADNGSDALSSVVKEYTNRYNYDNNLWGNVFGGKAKVKDAANTDVYGFTLGYDKAFDNTIVGGFFTLAKAQSDGNNVKNDANNYSFGVYTRSYFGQNELDSKFAYGFAKNTLKTKSSLIGDNEGKYDSKYFDIALDYGYVFDIGNAKFVKPIFGLEYTNLKNDSFTAGGPVELNFAKTSVKTLNAKLGAEFRAYTEKGDYFYVTPGIERELSKSADDSVLNFAGSRNVTFDADKKKYTYATLKTGAEFKITNSLSTNINFGVKARSKNQFYNGTLGLSYKF